MKNSLIKPSWIIVICLVWVTAVACNPTHLQPVTTARAIATTTLTPSSTIFVPTQAPTTTPTQPPFASPTPKPTSTRPPTLTPLPTIPPDDAAIFVEQLLENNAGCQFPCWWGIIPGESSWPEARNFLDTFAIEYSIRGYGAGRSGYSVSVPSIMSDRNISYGFYVLDNIVYGVSTGYGGLTWRNYELHQILHTYGPPKEVWIQTFWREYLPFRVVLFYPHLGIMVLYQNHGSTGDDTIVGCPQEVDEFPDLSSPPRLPLLWLFTPNENVTLVEVADLIAQDWGVETYLPLEQATDINVDMFYETFKEADNTTCLITPVELW